MPAGSGLRRNASLLAVAVLAAALAGCGRRGNLEPPPDPSVRAATSAADTSPQASFRRPKNPPIKPPHDSFILDPLL